MGFGVVAIWAGDVSAVDFPRTKFLGYAAIIGLSGKENTAILSACRKTIFGFLDSTNRAGNE